MTFDYDDFDFEIDKQVQDWANYERVIDDYDKKLLPDIEEEL